MARQEESEPGSKSSKDQNVAIKEAHYAFKPIAPVLNFVDKSVSVSLCCHDTSKKLAILEQRLQFKDEQVEAERVVSRLKEAQYEQMIQALKVVGN